MNVSVNWLSEFLRRPLDPAEVADRLGALGAPADAVEPLHAELRDIVVGLVESAVQHPNADRLRVCVVDDGSGTRRHVVCGAPNVSAGRRYPFAPVGATLPGGLRIEKRKLRGEVSEGMLCSARELGLGDDHQGLWELATDAPPGTPLLQAVPLADTRLVLDITPNRPDLLGHKGIARELAVSYGVQFRLPSLPGSPGGTMAAPARAGAAATTGGVRVAIEDAEGCPRFLGAVLRGVRVAPSPDWLARRLAAVGIRSINNVVDATNYVMLELNQPMHAYDLARLRGAAVMARRARPGERLVTLDGAERALDPAMTVIADAEGAIGVAGVMGGAGSEVSDDTRNLFLECAYFDPSRIRRARRALNLSTDASYRFERGVDRWNGAEAMRRCVELIQLTAGGELASDPVAWRRAVEAARRPSARGFLLPYALLRLGEAELAAGDRPAAKEALQAAFDSAVAGGVTAVQSRAARVAMAAGVALDGASAGDAGGGASGVAGSDDPADATAELTARERQVLELIAQGLSNRQIGERLFISGKTASVHVSAILRKLGASSRTEAAFLARALR